MIRFPTNQRAALPGEAGASLRVVGPPRISRPPSLFNQNENPGNHDDLSLQDGPRKFIASQARISVLPWDHLPYTPEFEHIVAKFSDQFDITDALAGISHDSLMHGVWLLGTRVRKAGEATPFANRRHDVELPPVLACPYRLRRSVDISLSKRDRLPYSNSFSTYCRNYNRLISATGFPRINKREFWLAIVSEAKRSRIEEESARLLFDRQGYPSDSVTPVIPAESVGQLDLFENT